jgi:hypothetical protein
MADQGTRSSEACEPSLAHRVLRERGEVGDQRSGNSRSELRIIVSVLIVNVVSVSVVIVVNVVSVVSVSVIVVSVSVSVVSVSVIVGSFIVVSVSVVSELRIIVSVIIVSIEGERRCW